jgi:histone-lysine N-methyltransferase SETMAR
LRSSQTIETINHLGIKVLENPAYSPDLAPSDYHLFGPLKNALQCQRFYMDKEVQGVVHKWLRNQPKASS